MRDDNGRRLPSVSETSRSPPDVFGMPLYPGSYIPSQAEVQAHQQQLARANAHQQRHSMQSAASMMGGGVKLS